MKRLHTDLIPIVAWMAFIFVISSDMRSYENSSDMLCSLLDWLDAHLSAEAYERLLLALRKGGHLFEYSVLALLILHSARVFVRAMYAKWSWKAAAISLVASTAYAATDELHQVFVPSRSASLQDVYLDACGALLGLIVAYLWKRRLRLRSHDAQGNLVGT